MKIDGMSPGAMLARRALVLAADRTGYRKERREFMERHMLPISKSSCDNRIALVNFAIDMLDWRNK